MASLIKRNNIYYIQDRIGGKLKRQSLNTTSKQIAKDKLRQYQSAKLRGHVNPLPTRTPIAQVMTAYVAYIRARKTLKSAQTDIYYLREAFGPICDALTITSRKSTAKKRPAKTSKLDRRKCMQTIEAPYFEAITTTQVAALIDFKVRDQGVKPKTANNYRSILRRVFNWATEEFNLRLPNCDGGRSGTNPAAKVRPYKEHASEISYLNMLQIDEQLHALRFNPRLQTMVALLIYAGVRREELLWITKDDIILTPAPGSVPGSNRPSMIRIQAKTINGQYWQPKTKRNRAVPISKSLRQYLDRYTPLENEYGLYFPSPKGELWDPDNFSSDLRNANKAANLQWACLDYRHTFGSQLAQNGVSLYKISTLMGNSPEICRKHYASLVPEALVEEVEFGEAMRSFQMTKQTY